MKGHRHPQASAKPGLVVGAIERMPIVGTTKAFHMWNEATVCTIETVDTAGRKRGGVCIGISKDMRGDGVATCSSIEEARAIVALIENAIADAERIERGEWPIAEEGRQPPTHHRCAAGSMLAWRTATPSCAAARCGAGIVDPPSASTRPMPCAPVGRNAVGSP